MEYVSFILTIVGVVITIYGLYLANRSKKTISRPCKIKYYPIDTLNIFNLSNQFEKFNIMYDGTSIDKNLIYISGKFICEGQDISTKENKIKLELIDKSSWIDFSVEKSNDEIIADIKKSDSENNIAYLCFDNLRQNEFIEINALINPNQNQAEEDVFSFQNGIQLTHRIDNTDVITEPIKRTMDLKKSLKFCGLLLSVCCLSFLFLFMLISIVSSRFEDITVMIMLCFTTFVLLCLILLICRELLDMYRKNH